MKKTKDEKEAEYISNLALDVTGIRNIIEKNGVIDVSATIPGIYLSAILSEKREKIEPDFKLFCKKNKLKQYKVKDIENGSLKTIDIPIFDKYIELIKAKFEVKAWIKRFPNIAKKYKITV